MRNECVVKEEMTESKKSLDESFRASSRCLGQSEATSGVVDFAINGQSTHLFDSMTVASWEMPKP